MDTQEEIRRGAEADRLLENPLLQECFVKIRDGILASMNESAFGDDKTHHHLVIALQLASQIEKQLRDIAATGRMAKLQIKDGAFGKLRAASGF